MPYYYLISEVRVEPNASVFTGRCAKKPDACNLLFPSIHPGREDNVLEAHSDAQKAVAMLLASSRDSVSWPSMSFESGDCRWQHRSDVQSITQDRHKRGIRDQEVEYEEIIKPPKHQINRKTSSWTYDADAVDAARALFMERRRQKAVYDALPTWYNPVATPRIPSDYELFAAWACLSRSEKMAYIYEVSGGCVSPLPGNNAVETQRAVSALYASCNDSNSWPSFQFSRAQAPPPPASPTTPHTNPLLAAHLPLVVSKHRVW